MRAYSKKRTKRVERNGMEGELGVVCVYGLVVMVVVVVVWKDTLFM